MARGAEISERVRSSAERDDRAAIRAILEAGSATYRLSFEEKQRRLDAATVAFQGGFTASAAINALQAIDASWGLAFPDHLAKILAKALDALGANPTES